MRKYFILSLLAFFLTACDKEINVDGVYKQGNVDFTFKKSGDNIILSYLAVTGFRKSEVKTLNCHFVKEDKSQLICIGQNNFTQTFLIKNEETLLNQRGEILTKVK